MEASNLVPDSLLRRMRADRGMSMKSFRDPSRRMSRRSAAPVKRIALAMALSGPKTQISLISWLGKG